MISPLLCITRQSVPFLRTWALLRMASGSSISTSLQSLVRPFLDSYLATCSIIWDNTVLQSLNLQFPSYPPDESYRLRLQPLLPRKSLGDLTLYNCPAFSDSEVCLNSLANISSISIFEPLHPGVFGIIDRSASRIHRLCLYIPHDKFDVQYFFDFLGSRRLSKRSSSFPSATVLAIETTLSQQLLLKAGTENSGYIDLGTTRALSKSN
jgi:hypothetical protein